MKRSTPILIAAVIGTVFFIIALIGYGNAGRAASADASDFAAGITSLAASIAMTFMTPYIVTFGFGLGFCLLGWLMYRREPVLISIVLYAVSLALALGNFWLLILPLISTAFAYSLEWYFTFGRRA